MAARLNRAIAAVEAVEPLAKLNGATGNYNAHLSAYPEIDWPAFSQKVLAGLGLTQNRHTIRSSRTTGCRRCSTPWSAPTSSCWTWTATSGAMGAGLLLQRLKEGEVGSSTMPHKVNPIDFENSEGNLGLANAVLPPGRQAADLPLAARPDRLHRAAQPGRGPGLLPGRLGRLHARPGQAGSERRRHRRRHRGSPRRAGADRDAAMACPSPTSSLGADARQGHHRAGPA